MADPVEPPTRDILLRLRSVGRDDSPQWSTLWFGEAADEINRLRQELNRHGNRWFYLTCHPEHAELVAKEMLFGTELTRDQFGHVTGAVSSPPSTDPAPAWEATCNHTRLYRGDNGDWWCSGCGAPAEVPSTDPPSDERCPTCGNVGDRVTFDYDSGMVEAECGDEWHDAVPSLPVPDPPDVLDDLALRLCVPRARLDTALSDSGAVVVFAEGLNNGDRLVRFRADAWRRVLTDKEPQ